MGLDAWIFSLPRDVDASVDFTISEDEETLEIGYWRKNHTLHLMLANLYDDRGGMGIFNCDRLVLDSDDLDDLEIFVRGLDYAQDEVGWDSLGEQTSLEYDLAILEKARTEINKGHTVYYDSWW